MNENIRNIAYTMGKSNVLCSEDCGNCIQTENNCKLIRQATTLYKLGYRKQSETVKEFAEKLKEECHKAITHNYTAMDNRKKADEMWYVCCGQNEGLNFVIKRINKLAEQFGEEKEK